MKLFTFREDNHILNGVLEDGIYYNTSTLFPSYDASFFENDGLASLKNALDTKNSSLTVIGQPEKLAFGAPFATPSKIICIGLNYADHARETGAEIPKEPIIFMKSTTSFSGCNDPVMIPKDSVKTDWEVELAVVISKKARYVSAEESLHHIAGYCVHNDVSEREFQLERGGTWDKGKGCDTFAPMGPFLVTPDEAGDVHNLPIWLSLNGVKVQNSNTSNLVFSIPELIAYISRFMTLLPGDVISTGTPPGVGLGFKPPIYLKPGDVMELGIEGLGTMRQETIAFSLDYEMPKM